MLANLHGRFSAIETCFDAALGAVRGSEVAGAVVGLHGAGGTGSAAAAVDGGGSTGGAAEALAP